MDNNQANQALLDKIRSELGITITNPITNPTNDTTGKAPELNTGANTANANTADANTANTKLDANTGAKTDENKPTEMDVLKSVLSDLTARLAQIESKLTVSTEEQTKLSATIEQMKTIASGDPLKKTSPSGSQTNPTNKVLTDEEKLRQFSQWVK